MRTSNAPLLSLTGLSASIGGQPVLQDVGFSLDGGQCLAVVGSSGAGKTTLLRLILGLRKPARPEAGLLWFDDTQRDMAQSKTGKPDGIAYVPQSPEQGFDPVRRLQWQWDQLRRILRKKAQGEELFRTFALPDLNRAFPGEWSRGMQQRLLVAMALLEQPKLLILDEPTSALDPLIAAQVLSEVLRVAQSRNIAVMIVTHDLALATRFADHIAILHQGRLVDFGPKHRVLNAPACEYAAELVAYRGWHRATQPKLAAE